VDAVGNVYVADTDNNRVQKLSPDGVSLAQWGTQAPALGQFLSPSGVAVDNSGSIYVADSGNNRIQKLAPNGESIAQYGGMEPPRSSNVLSFPSGLTLSMHWDCFSCEWPTMPPGHFHQPQGLAIDSQGNIYVADRGNHRIQKLSATGEPLAQWGIRGTDPGQFHWLSGVAVDIQGNIYVAEDDNLRVQKLSATGEPLAEWHAGADVPSQRMGRVRLDAEGNVYVADSYHNRIQKLSPALEPLAQWGSSGTESGQFQSPAGVAVDSLGNVYVADTGNNRIQKLTSPALRRD
jgi:DNA-binding beta-propeller fold protein YncE